MGFKITKNKINNSENVYFIGEVGINHNGDLDLAKKIIFEAKKAGFSSVKFQKRNPELSTPEDIKHRLNNPNDIDIRKATEYNNKKDHRNEVNMENIKEEVAGEQRMQELELGSGSLTDDSLSFSFL